MVGSAAGTSWLVTGRLRSSRTRTDCTPARAQVRFVLKDDIRRQLDSGNIVFLSNIGQPAGRGGLGRLGTGAVGSTVL